MDGERRFHHYAGPLATRTYLINPVARIEASRKDLRPRAERTFADNVRHALTLRHRYECTAADLFLEIFPSNSFLRTGSIVPSFTTVSYLSVSNSLIFPPQANFPPGEILLLINRVLGGIDSPRSRLIFQLLQLTIVAVTLVI